MKGWDAYLFGGVAAVRPFLLVKAFLTLFALDICMQMLIGGTRFSSADFNVAQLPLLDLIQPTPTRGLYVGLLLTSGLLSLVIVLAGTNRTLLALLCGAYSWSWLMSMLDSFQHHYFISILLVGLVFIPVVRVTDIHPLEEAPAGDKRKKQRRREELQERERAGWRSVGIVVAGVVAALAYWTGPGTPTGGMAWAIVAVAVAASTALRLSRVEEGPRVPAWGFALIGASCAVVYLYTAIAKMNPQWVSGFAFRQLGNVEVAARPLQALFAAVGVSEQTFWPLMACAVVPLELLIAAGYAVAPLRDRGPARWPTTVCGAAWFAAMVVHLGAEMLTLQIGWFSYYMLLIATVYFLPERVLIAGATFVTWPARWVVARGQALQEKGGSPSVGATTAVAVAAGGVVWGAFYTINLPGSAWLGGAAAVFLVAASVASAARGDGAHVRAVLGAAAVGSVVMLLAVSSTNLRWDFYRASGGDFGRRGLPEEALASYIEAEQYAPPGQSRRQKIDRLRQQLGR
ncbi:MAG: HTTM domain-containing protein [Candidatus Binatia bacterium]|nr:HTTM domain-containing protein [Candidatus Binatia bacterium]